MVLSRIAVLAIALPQIHASGIGDGSSSANACPGNCVSGPGGKSCTFTAKLNLFASATGYYTFEECGSQVQPVLEMERGVKYTFLQNDATNWLHPLGFAYEPDGAHEDVDELEPGISKTSSSCDTDNTCSAPMYYFEDTFYGSKDEDGNPEPTVYPASGNAGNFGLDHYEPLFQRKREDWIGMRDAGSGNKWNVQLTITDNTLTQDIFYFCHIHNKMSGRIKILDNLGSQVNAQDSPALYDHVTPSNFDAGCGTFGLKNYSYGQTCPALASNKFLCASEGETDTVANFNECLHAMDCAMHTEMRVNAHPTDPMTTFMHQMIPHHHNAVNMAKAALKILPAGSDPELEDLFYTIINEQNMQITYMEGYLSGNNRATYVGAQCSQPTVPSTNPVVQSSTAATTDIPSTVAGTANANKATDSCDCDDNTNRTEMGYLVWAIVVTNLLICSFTCFYVRMKNVHQAEASQQVVKRTEF